MLKRNFNLDNSFYDPEHVSEAIAAFGDDFSLSYKDGVLDIAAESVDEIDEIFHEFINYVIALYNESI